MIFVTFSGYLEHYPNRVNYAIFLMNSMNLEISSTTTVNPSCTWVKIFDLLTLPAKMQKNRARLGPKLK